MPLTLVTGPANAAKAGVVLAALRRPAGGDGLLVVPTAADAAHYRRELAESGLVLGPQVVTFDGLIGELARALGHAARPLGRHARERVIASVVRSARLERLAASAAGPGFVAATGALFTDLRHARATPERLAAALRTWASGDARRAAFGTELVRLYRGYDEALAALGRPDADQHAWETLTALRARPAAWGGRTVAFYGWDDLDPVQIDAVETLARVAGAPVVLSLPFEPGRAAFAARAGLVERLREQADEHQMLGPRDDYYGADARGALYHLERHLFEDAAPRRESGDALRLLEAGGERAEAELISAEVERLLDGGIAPGEIALALRAAPAERAAFAELLAGLGLPVAAVESVPLGETALGAGLLALGRAALPGGRADDLVRWLRTPGRLDALEPLDALDRRVRRERTTGAAGARRRWEERGGPPLEELDRVRAAAEVGSAALLDALEAELAVTWTAPHRRRGAVLDATARGDAALAGALARACAELRELARADPEALGSPQELLAGLAELPVEPPASSADGVLLADPSAIRGRRFRAVIACGLQASRFPRPPRPDPFLDDAERRDLARASGLVLPSRERGLADERYLFYACLSRPTDALALSFRSCDDEGEPEQASPFVDDVRALFDDTLWSDRRRRLLADLGVPAAPPDAMGDVVVGLGPPQTASVRALLGARRRESARGLESFACCPARWLIEQVLHPAPVDPDAEALQRGALAHRALERTLSLLRERTGSARLTPERLPDARAALADALGELDVGRAGASGRVMLRGLEASLERLLRHEAETGPGLEPAYLEWGFGAGDDGPPPLALAGVEVSGRIDRIDVDSGGGAIVRDYKGARGHPRAEWRERRHLQVALYLLAVERLLGLRPLAGVYQPLAGSQLRARGLVRDGDEARELVGRGHWVRTDAASGDDFAALLEWAREQAERVAAELRAGRIEARPEQCTPVGCRYPEICRGVAR